MRKTLLYILLTLLLTACDFFYSEVPFKGDEEDPVLVVNSTIDLSSTEGPQVHVSRSFFFMDSTQYVWHHEGGYSYAMERKRGLLSNADVSLQIGNSTPISLGYQTEVSTEYNEKGDTLGYYVLPAGTPFHIQPGDSVWLRVAHEQYGTAEAVQVCPYLEQGEMRNVRTNKYGELTFDLSLPAYTGTANDVIAVEAEVHHIKGTVYSRLDILHKSPLYEISYIGYPYLYSPDPVFDELSNDKTESGYWGGTSIYLPTSALKQPQRIACVLDLHMTDPASEVVVIDTMQLSLKTTSLTYDGYQYKRSYMRAVIGDTELPELTSKSSSSGTDIMEYIREIFDELGGQEDYQLYGNMSGTPQRPYGHFAIQQQAVVEFTYERTDE